MRTFFLITVAAFMLSSCGSHHERPEKKSTNDTVLDKDTGMAKKEIMKIYEEFSSCYSASGMSEAFSKFMTDDGVYLKSDHQPIKTKDSVVAFFKKKKITDLKMTRTPALFDISSTGDMAYVYGTYQVSGLGPKGNQFTTEGSFVSVWKKTSGNVWQLALECDNEGLAPEKKTK